MNTKKWRQSTLYRWWAGLPSAPSLRDVEQGRMVTASLLSLLIILAIV